MKTTTVLGFMLLLFKLEVNKIPKMINAESNDLTTEWAVTINYVQNPGARFTTAN